MKKLEKFTTVLDLIFEKCAILLRLIENQDVKLTLQKLLIKGICREFVNIVVNPFQNLNLFVI